MEWHFIKKNAWQKCRNRYQKTAGIHPFLVWMLWYLLVFALFGAKNVFAFQIVSALAVTALVAVLWRCSGVSAPIWGLMRWAMARSPCW